MAKDDWKSRHPKENLEIQRRWREKNAVAVAEYQRNYQPKWRKDNAAKVKKDHRIQHLLRRHGLTQAEYDQMLAAQGGVFAICSGKNLNKQHRGVLCVDHSHETKKRRGLLCDLCNVGIGRFKDDPALLRKAAEYLEKTS